MSKTSSTVKNRYNAKAYDQLPVRVPKGRKDFIKSAADAANESLNGYIIKAIDDRMIREGYILDEKSPDTGAE